MAHGRLCCKLVINPNLAVSTLSYKDGMLVGPVTTNEYSIDQLRVGASYPDAKVGESRSVNGGLLYSWDSEALSDHSFSLQKDKQSVFKSGQGVAQIAVKILKVTVSESLVIPQPDGKQIHRKLFATKKK